MNVSAKHKSNIPWRRIIPIVLVGLVLGYSYSRPTLERWFNISLPAINERNGGRFNQNQNRSSDNNNDSGGDYNASLPKDFSVKSGSSKSGSSKSSKYKLEKVGSDRYETPAGLLYGMGARGEHRIEHVMRHAQDQPGRPSHGVFIGDGDQDTVLKLIDEAYELVKAKSPRAKYESSRGNDKYDVDMQRKVGFDGGQKGKRNNHASLDKIRMILDNNRVITAFPVR